MDKLEEIYNRLVDLPTSVKSVFKDACAEYCRYIAQECYNEATTVENGEGEVAKAIVDKFPFISRITK